MMGIKLMGMGVIVIVEKKNVETGAWILVKSVMMEI